MHAAIAPNHPKQKLLFFVAQRIDASIRANVGAFVLRLAGLRPWLNGPPRFVNTRAEPDATTGVMPVETVGGYLEIYTALPPWTLPREVDLEHLDEATVLINEVSAFSREHNLGFEFEIDGTYVGSVENGKMDRSLAEGLLGEWRRHLRVGNQ